MKEGAIIHRIGVIASDSRYEQRSILGLSHEPITGLCPAPFHGYPKGGERSFPVRIFQYPSDSAASGSPPLQVPPIKAAKSCSQSMT